jgi:hypothetical protein
MTNPIPSPNPPSRLTATSTKPEEAILEIRGEPRGFYEVFCEAILPDGSVFSTGHGFAETNQQGRVVWNEFGAGNGTGVPYTARFTVNGVTATCTVVQEAND